MASQHSKDEQPSGFFSISAKYVIDPNSSIQDLMDDAACLLEVGVGALGEGHESLQQTGWCALYALRQAKAVFEEFLRRLPPSAWEAIRAEDAKLTSS